MKLRYFNLAKKLSKKSTHQFQLACVIVKKNIIISLGVNSIKTHPKSLTPYRMTHAEVDAVASANIEDLNGATAYLYRENKAGDNAISKPCPYCEMLLKRVGIKTVYYTVEGGYEKASY